MAITIRVELHLIVGQKFREINGKRYTDGKPSVRVCKGKPAVEPHEVAMALCVDLPVSLFVRPQLTATITVPEDKAPFIITPEVRQNIAKAMSEQLGITMTVSAPESAAPPNSD